jgi:uncharacterized membrane protein YagU involved in acid resistance
MIRTPTGFLPTALIAGLVAGVLDIGAAILQNMPTLTAQTVLQSVASGWLGGEAFQGGWPIAWLGLASHFAIMLGLAGVYVWLTLMQPTLRRRWLIAGQAWGVAVWLLMSLVVVPLSAAPFSMTDETAKIIRGLITHILAVGLPMAAVARWRLGDARVA